MTELVLSRFEAHGPMIEGPRGKYVRLADVQVVIDALEGDRRLLQCLRNCGVDNWEGWEDAIDQFNE